MRKESLSKIAVVRSADPDEFTVLVNTKMDELAELNPTHQIVNNGDTLTAIITYQETHTIIETIADEYHAEGIYFLCKHCPYLDDPHDKRIKRCTCRYANSGIAYKDSEACEVFYRALKRGDIKPLEDYLR